mmetsp:Transcript_150271/g.261791  ORF Transcript_150271/g.261791 Transcript_150271/m.261791 type:complete len:82 (+) Transcript_150271:375-620(+)
MLKSSSKVALERARRGPFVGAAVLKAPARAPPADPEKKPLLGLKALREIGALPMPKALPEDLKLDISAAPSKQLRREVAEN